MPTNVFFNHAVNTEQHLYEDLVVESLRMYGQDTLYLPRTIVQEDTILGEDVQSKFGDAYGVEMYIENPEGFEGEGDLMSKFGVQQQDDVTLIISWERWETYIQPLIQNEKDIKLASRPKGGDLIYFPLDDRLYEIKYLKYTTILFIYKYGKIE